jgi:hypothetical protein
MEYKLGAVKNPKDLRDIQLVKVQPPVAIPDKYFTDISFIPVLNQKGLGACVGHAHAIVHIYNEWKENKKVVKLSPRYLYALSKKLDGLQEEGTYPRTTAKVQNDKGCATEEKVPNLTDLPHADYINLAETEEITKDAKPYKTKGYTNVARDLQSLKQAIFQNGVVPITISVGNFDNPIKRGSFGLHRVVAYGYDGSKIYYRNSWGEGWGDKGNGYLEWNDQDLYDMMVFLDLPNEVILEAKKKYQYFSQAEVDKYKLEDVMWRLLDKMRGECGFPFIPESGRRTKDQNDALKMSASDSAHLSGLAVDLRVKDSYQRDKLVDVAKKNGITRIGIGENFVHLDIDPSKPQNVMWTYYQYYKKV